MYVCVCVCVCVFQSMMRWPIFARVTCRCSLLTYHYSWVPVPSLFGGTSNARPIIPNSARARRPPRRTCMYPSLVIRHVILAYHDPVPYCQPADGHMDGSVDRIYIPMHLHIYIHASTYIHITYHTGGTPRLAAALDAGGVSTELMSLFLGALLFCDEFPVLGAVDLAAGFRGGGVPLALGAPCRGVTGRDPSSLRMHVCMRPGMLVCSDVGTYQLSIYLALSLRRSLCARTCV